MKRVTFILLAFLYFTPVRAQQKKIDSLNALIKATANDTLRGKYLINLAKLYMESRPVKALEIGQQVYTIGLANDYYKLTRSGLGTMANMYVYLGDYTKGMQSHLELLKMVEAHQDRYYIVQTYNNIASAYIERGDYETALGYLGKGKKMMEEELAAMGKPSFRTLNLAAYFYENIGHAQLYLGHIDSAEKQFAIVGKFVELGKLHEFSTGYYNDLGLIQSARGNQQQAMVHFNKAIRISLELNDLEELDRSYTYIARMQICFHQPDSAIVNAHKALGYAQQARLLQHVLEISKMLYTLYDQQKNIPAAYQYYKLTTAANDSINSQKKIRELMSMDFDERQRQQDILAAKTAYKNQVRTYILVAIVLIALLAAIVFRRNAIRRQKLNIELQSTLSQLKQTQKQLIRSEKMAALGQLTTGVAHEMLNPLNFVNNFSEVSLELITELTAEEEQGHKEDVLAIAGDLATNLQKIRDHGKRADAIVKGMLEHSRSNSQEREATDLNNLIDEAIKLSEQSFRSKAPGFQLNVVKHYDSGLPLIQLVPGDISRVIQNLLSNAFYAVQEKAVTSGADFQPDIHVSTALAGQQVIVKIKDNGTGVSEAIRDKIWQPFFTTKPTGSGTGLGLSLSYEIIVNGHDGRLDLETATNAYSEFILQLPLAQ